VAGYYLKNFAFDASADTLVVQGDPKLATYRKMTEFFGGDEFIVLTYSRDQILIPEALSELEQLQSEISQLEGVKQVFSILDAPLIDSPPVPLEKMRTDYRTLRSDDTDLALAKAELTSSPLFANFLISVDATATALRIDLINEPLLESLRERRDLLRALNGPTASQQAELIELTSEYHLKRIEYVTRRENLVSRLRELKDNYRGEADIFISGVPMIAADMISFVKSDLIIFGSLVFLLIIILLFFFFRRPRWVFMPLMVSGMSILLTMGVLGIFEKPVTVISSNFVALLAIICISFSVHLIVRYRELLGRNSELAHIQLVRETMSSKFIPCLYTALTTILAFGSMLFSRIVPVEDFGWMMCLGIVIAFMVTYTVFPSLLLLLGVGEPSRTLGENIKLTALLSKFCRHYSLQIVIGSVILVGVASYGISLVTYDNRFSDYFDDDTDIHQGMVFIDQHLGGTIPLDIYLQYSPWDNEEMAEDDDFFSTTVDPFPERYWFTLDKVEAITRLHDFLLARTETGKVVSLSTLEKFSRRFTNDQPLSGLEISFVLGELPDEVRAQLIQPYARPSEGLIRINARIKETGPLFSRDQLVEDILSFTETELDIAPDRVIVSGMYVLFNDMLKQLADSQTRTLWYVIMATFLMFSLLLRSISLAMMALIPNILAAALVISVMGYAGIPMDMMTTTIAAISIGIGVDNAIHYMHRFRQERALTGNTAEAVNNAHLTIGRAMYFTTVVIIGGFSILAFSNFLPTVYFGLLTALAMGLALLANLTLLPSMLIQFYKDPKPS